MEDDILKIRFSIRSCVSNKQRGGRCVKGKMNYGRSRVLGNRSNSRIVAASALRAGFPRDRALSAGKRTIAFCKVGLVLEKDCPTSENFANIGVT